MWIEGKGRRELSLAMHSHEDTTCLELDQVSLATNIPRRGGSRPTAPTEQIRSPRTVLSSGILNKSKIEIVPLFIKLIFIVLGTQHSAPPLQKKTFKKCFFTHSDVTSSSRTTRINFYNRSSELRALSAGEFSGAMIIPLRRRIRGVHCAGVQFSVHGFFFGRRTH